MKKQMTSRGVGYMFTIISGIYTAIIFVIHFVWLPHLFLPLPRLISLIMGILLVIIGLPIFILPGMVIDKYFNEGKLAKEGVYAYLRHPIYGSWIVFIMPGIVFIINSLLGLTIPFFMYLVFRILIVEEEKYLEEKFGDEYFEYKKRVGSIFPKLMTILKK
jgi:protein-S-isoprenylcysteine O-methyltransferase Ste14